MPDAQQEQALGVTADELRDAHARALRQFAQVKEEHPNTPWSRRAEWEEKRQFGATFRDYYVAPPSLVQKSSKPPPKRMPVTQPPNL